MPDKNISYINRQSLDRHLLLPQLNRHSRQLVREVRGPSYGKQSHHARVAMQRLRQKREDDAAQPQFLLTEIGVGPIGVDLGLPALWNRQKKSLRTFSRGFFHHNFNRPYFSALYRTRFGRAPSSPRRRNLSFSYSL